MYNYNQYNVSVYNGKTESLFILDALTPNDIITELEFARLLYESQPIVDNLLRFFNQVDEMNLDYFNPEDEQTIEFNKAAVDAVATTDSVVTSFIKVLLETMSPADVATFVYSTAKVDSVVLVDTVEKSITDKRLTEILRLKDWISLRKTGQLWYD